MIYLVCPDLEPGIRIFHLADLADLADLSVGGEELEMAELGR